MDDSARAARLTDYELPAYDEPYRASRSAFSWLLQREVVRYMKMWHFTVPGQAVASLLFVFVFGLAIGSRIPEIDGIDYAQFILPGLVGLSIITAGFINGTASLFEARKDRFIDDVLASPLRWWEINLAVIMGSMIRCLLITSVILAVGIPITGARIARPVWFAVAVLIVLVLAALTGALAGLYAGTQEHVAAMQALAVQPLCYLGGVFYSVHQLPGVWGGASHLNPVFYAVQVLRFGFLGTSDIPVALAFSVLLAAVSVLGTVVALTFRFGWTLKA